MLYSKFPIIFLSAIASEKNGSTNSTIASYILTHLDEMKCMGITDFANNCNVSISSISRFCKDIGLIDFAELKEILITNEYSRDLFEKEEDFDKRIAIYSDKITDSIKQASRSISEQKLNNLLIDIRKFKKVAAFGLLKAQTAAIILQSDLIMCEKNIYTNLSYKEQMDYIENADEETLILIFTYTGSYFEYNRRRNFMKKKHKGKIWMISGHEGIQPDFISDSLIFNSLQNHISHPYQLDFIATTIAKEYQLLISK